MTLSCMLQPCHYGCSAMPDGIWPILILIAVVIVYALSKIRYYMRKSDEQWLSVDKSKLREWDDEDEEDDQAL